MQEAELPHWQSAVYQRKLPLQASDAADYKNQPAAFSRTVLDWFQGRLVVVGGRDLGIKK